nr:MAG TPA: tail repeat-like protein [Caudoviricetes sp.]
MSFVTKSKLQRFFTGLKDVFAAKNHTHNDKVDNTETGANGLLAKLTTSWSAAPTDDTYFIRQDTGGGNTFGRLKFSTAWTYIKGKADSIYQPKGSYATSGHTHDDRYYTESEIDSKLKGKAASTHTHTKSQITDFPTSLPASDVYTWAKASAKPSYSWGEITGKPSAFTPSGHSHNTFGKATANAAGSAGFVPAPAKGQQGLYLRGDGTWATPTNTTYGVASQSANGLMSATDKKKFDTQACFYLSGTNASGEIKTTCDYIDGGSY